jgi:hypothetical protein
MAYDKVRDYTVLFGGGNDDGVSSETWLWDGTQWVKEHPTTSPPPAWGGRAVFDPVLGRVVVLAGDGENPGTTWSWDGADWIQEAPAVGPDAREWAAGAFDESDGAFIIFGGSWGCGEIPCVLGDTWTWDGAKWNQESPPASPSRRSGAAAAYNPIQGQVVLFGGWNFDYYNDTWTWDGANWTPEDPARSPRQRADAELVFDDSLGEVLLFGGGIVFPDNRHYSFNDLWAWDGTTWTRIG